MNIFFVIQEIQLKSEDSKVKNSASEMREVH